MFSCSPRDEADQRHLNLDKMHFELVNLRRNRHTHMAMSCGMRYRIDASRAFVWKDRTSEQRKQKKEKKTVSSLSSAWIIVMWLVCDSTTRSLATRKCRLFIVELNCFQNEINFSLSHRTRACFICPDVRPESCPCLLSLSDAHPEQLPLVRLFRLTFLGKDGNAPAQRRNCLTLTRTLSHATSVRYFGMIFLEFCAIYLRRNDSVSFDYSNDPVQVDRPSHSNHIHISIEIEQIVYIQFHLSAIFTNRKRRRRGGRSGCETFIQQRGS